MNEADYITRQTDQAGAAIAGVIGDMKAALGEAADIKEWTRQYPWLVTSSAAVAGFVAGMALIPSKDESFKSKWEALKDKLTPDLEAQADRQATARTIADQPNAGGSPSWLSVVLREVLKAVGPTIGGVLTGALAGQQAQQPPSGNGHQSHPEHPVGPPPTV